MFWYGFLTIAAAILIATWIFAIALGSRRHGRLGILTPIRLLFAGTFVSSFVLHLPVYLEEFGDAVSLIRIGKTLLASLHHTMQLFAMEGSFVDTVAGIEYADQTFLMLYSGFSAIVYVSAPIMTFGFILSFFKNLASYRKYITSFYTHTHVFSRLNEKSIALACSIVRSGDKDKLFGLFSRVAIVFTDVGDDEDEESSDLYQQAKDIGAILFRKDFESIKFRSRRSARKLSFYLIGEDESEKISQTNTVVGKYNYPDTKLYLFSDNVQSKYLFQSYTKEERAQMNIEVMRINDVRSLIYSNLYENGIRLFENAEEEDGHRVIKATIVGFGKYGGEMLRALLWYCQLPDYEVRIKVVDREGDAKAKLEALCPDLPYEIDVGRPGDMRYRIDVIQDSAGTNSFVDAIKDSTYVFICLGNDEVNISTALDVRCRLAKESRYPDIETVVYDSSLKKRISTPWSERENGLQKKTDMTAYGIHTIGDIESYYSEETVIDSELIDEGLRVHLRWESCVGVNAKNNFFMNDYNFFSSVAKALHGRLRKQILGHPQRERVFPTFFATEEKAADEAAMYERVLKGTQTPEDASEFASELSVFSEKMYAKLAHIHLKKLSGEDLAFVARRVGEMADDEEYENSAFLCERAEAVIADYLSADKDGKGLMKNIFTANEELRLRKRGTKTVHEIRRGLEYPALSDEDKAELAEFMESVGESLTPEAAHLLVRCCAMFDHVRWNAYMRTEGYSYTPDNAQRLYKQHSNLVPVDMLTFSACIKDV